MEVKKYLLLATITAALTIGGVFVYENWERVPTSPEDLPAIAGTKTEERAVRKPAAAGTFYPGGEEGLSAEIDKLLTAVKVPKDPKPPKILVVPHAGYQYSGQVAAQAFAEIKNREYSTVIIISNSHHYHFDGAAVYTEGFFETPLGQVPIDETLAQKLIGENNLIFAGPQYHEEEHSLEVEIPFLQKTLKDFQITPIILGDQTTETASALAEALAKHIDPYTLVVISTDLSHYPSYEDAQKADQQVIDSIATNDLEKFSELIETLPQSGIPNLQTAACGAGAIKTALLLSESLGLSDIQLLKYANSGSLPIGDKTRVVGYAAIAFYGERFGADLTDEEKEELLEISRYTLNTFTTTNQNPTAEIEHKFLKTPLGAFVTLHKNGALRGCTGSFEPEKPLWQVVQEMTIAAATKDSRFTPVTPDELEDIEIEVSVLSPRRRIFDPQNIKIGKHGVSLTKNGRHGVFLPQVATENNWGLEKFLGELCSQKTGLSPTCWQDSTTQISVFTAQIFAEEEAEAQ